MSQVKSSTVLVIEEKLHGLEIAAARLGIALWTLRAWVQKGKVASNKLGGRRLIAESEIQRLIESSHVPARADAETKTATA